MKKEDCIIYLSLILLNLIALVLSVISLIVQL